MYRDQVRGSEIETRMTKVAPRVAIFRDLVVSSLQNKRSTFAVLVVSSQVLGDRCGVSLNLGSKNEGKAVLFVLPRKLSI